MALKLALGASDLSYAELGKSLGMSASEVHAAVRRLTEARLLDPETKRVRVEPLRNFLVHGVPYVFPANPKAVTRGMPTAWAAPVMADKISSSDQLPPVWPDRRAGCRVRPCSRCMAACPEPPAGTRNFITSSRWWMPCASVGRGNGRSPKRKSASA